MVVNHRDEIEVVMAVYNGSCYLEEQINSIYNQTLKPVRLIVRDDCSSDSSFDLLQELQTRYGKWLILLTSKKRLGCTENFSILLQTSQAPYVAIADQDDIWDPDKLEISYSACKNNEITFSVNTPILIHSDLRLIDHNGFQFKNSFLNSEGLNPNKNSIDDLLLQNVITGCTIFVNRSLLNKALPIPTHNFMHDLWLGLVAARFGHIEFIPKSLISYRQHHANLLGAKGMGLSYGLSKIVHIFRYGRADSVSNYFLQSEIFYNRYAGNPPLLLEYKKAGILKRSYILILAVFKKHGLKRQILFAFSLLAILCLDSDRLLD